MSDDTTTAPHHDLGVVTLAIPANASSYGVDWDDLSYMKVLTCTEHPTYRWLTKNLWERSLFFEGALDPITGEHQMVTECSCSLDNLRVIIELSQPKGE